MCVGKYLTVVFVLLFCLLGLCGFVINLGILDILLCFLDGSLLVLDLWKLKLYIIQVLNQNRKRKKYCYDGGIKTQCTLSLKKWNQFLLFKEKAHLSGQFIKVILYMPDLILDIHVQFSNNIYTWFRDISMKIYIWNS